MRSCSLQAEEIIRKELQKGESVKLWCLLGDATDQPEYYEKAWLLSECKSARTQRQWGYYHYFRKQVCCKDLRDSPIMSSFVSSPNVPIFLSMQRLFRIWSSQFH